MDSDWENKIKSLMKEFQIENVDLNLLKDALTHSSYKGMGFIVKDNERLEFLGDATLNLVMAHQLFLNENLSEGEMTEKRKQFVSNEILAQLFDETGLNKLIRTANDFKLSAKNKAGFIEAISGAIFLDKGYEKCAEFWGIIQRTNIIKMQNIKIKEIKDTSKNVNDNEKSLVKNLDLIKINLEGMEHLPKLKDFQWYGDPNKNAKNILQEYCQKYRYPIPEYKLIKKEGPDHMPLFTVEVIGEATINNQKEKFDLIGAGVSKKIAEIKAAEKVCDTLHLNYKKTVIN